MTTRSIAAVSAMCMTLLGTGSAGCALEPQSHPPLAGPSELGLSLTVAITPDVLPQDGRSRAEVSVVARDASGRPVAGQALRVEIWVAGERADFGRLSSGVMTTGRAGRAVATYSAPEAPRPVADAPDTIVSFVVTPVGSNYASTVRRRADLRLTPPVVIHGPPG